MGKNILVAVAWPYANGPLHLGHIAGAYLPADIFARYHRLAGDRVLMVSGSDSHGTPITIAAEQQGVHPQEVVERFHAEFLGYWSDLDISFDLFTTTMTETHTHTVQDLFESLRASGLIERRSTQQFFDPVAGRFLPDRYVQGTCAACGNPSARGDQCEGCGRTHAPTDLDHPRSTLSGEQPVLRDTEHYFFLLGSLRDRLAQWLAERHGWRPHVINWARSFVAGELEDRSITRDLDWGIPIPNESLGPGKRFYVWFDAVIGYLSASQQWAEENGESWEDWWIGEKCESYYFIGKDNIPFHSIIWPAMLMGSGDLNLPTNVPANHHITFGGTKASKSAGVGRPLSHYLASMQSDSLRFALARLLPEQQDSELTDSELTRRVNDELVATWGNLVHRVAALSVKAFGGWPNAPAEVPPLLGAIDQTLVKAGTMLAKVEIKSALEAVLAAAREVNAYLNEKSPWHLVDAAEGSSEAALVLHTALSAVAGLNVAMAPFTPRTAEVTHAYLFGPDSSLVDNGWTRPSGPRWASPLDPPTVRYVRVEFDAPS